MRQMITEDVMRDVVNLIKGYFNNKKSNSKKKKANNSKSNDYSSKSSNGKSGKSHDRSSYRSKKLKGGGRTYYNFDDYQRQNMKTSKSDAAQISNEIDMDRTNISDLARKVFPNHTNNGAQSQLRKVLRGERPMTARVAHKISSEIATGGVAVK